VAQKIITELIDDIDGESEAAETVAFALDGKSYEIDLNEKNAAKLRAALAPFIKEARGVKAGGRPRTGVKRAAGPSTAEVRVWAQQQGIDVPSRGRLPKALLDQYAVG
jgi:hypothetical protein